MVLQRQSSRENDSMENDGLINDSFSLVMGHQQYQIQNPVILETTSFQALSLANGQAESIKSKSSDAVGKQTAWAIATLRKVRAVFGQHLSEPRHPMSKSKFLMHLDL